MRAVLVNPYRFRNIIGSITRYIHKACFVAGAGGLLLRAMDEDRRIYVKLVLTPGFFAEYETDETEAICVSLSDLRDTLEFVDARDKTELFTEEEYLGVRVRHGQFDDIFRLRTFEGEPLEAELKDIEYSVYARVDTQAMVFALRRIVEFMLTWPITIGTCDGRLRLGAESKRLRWTAYVAPSELRGEGESRYNILYIDGVYDTGIAGTVEMEFGGVVPLHVWYNLDGGRLDFYVAPMVVEE